MQKHLDDELKRILGTDLREPDCFEQRCARDFWIWKLAKAVAFAAFAIVGGCAVLVEFL